MLPRSNYSLSTEQSNYANEEQAYHFYFTKSVTAKKLQMASLLIAELDERHRKNHLHHWK